MTPTDTLPRRSGLGAIALTLRGEGALVACAAVYAFAHLGGNWLLFGLLILSPDLMMLGYLAGNRFGAICYNLAHSYLGPLMVGIWGIAGGVPVALEVALIWAAHVGIDRAVGYGLKYETGFKQTHMNRI